jgi:hypothetical protein
MTELGLPAIQNPFTLGPLLIPLRTGTDSVGRLESLGAPEYRPTTFTFKSKSRVEANLQPKGCKFAVLLT